MFEYTDKMYLPVTLLFENVCVGFTIGSDTPGIFKNVLERKSEDLQLKLVPYIYYEYHIIRCKYICTIIRSK
jgi:hypothetical protein